MTQAPVSLGGAAKAVVYAVIALGAAVLGHSVWTLVHDPVEPRWLVLAALTVGTSWIMLRIPTVQISFSISDTFNIAAAVMFGPAAGAATAALDALVLSSQFTFTRRTAYRVLFNIAASAIAIWIAASLFVALGSDRLFLGSAWDGVRLVSLLGVFAFVNYVLNTGLVAMAVALERRVRVLTVWKAHFAGLWATHVGGVLAAVPLLLLHRLRPPIGTLEMLALIVPVPAILYTTFRHAVGRAQDQVAHLGQLNTVYLAVIEALAQAVDAKDQVTHDHIRRVQTHALRLARRLGVTSEDELQALKAASLLHDIGKLSVPEHILNKPGRLTPSEFDVMKRHAPAGADILSVVGFPYPVVPIVRHHHENWDGTGYPDGIAGEQIPIGARILAVVDCFDALTSHRPYRPRLEDQDALKIITYRKGTMYDPRVVDAFLEMHREQAAEPAPATAPPEAPASAPAAPQVPVDRELLDLQASSDLGRTIAEAASVRSLAESLWGLLRGRIPACTFVLYAYDQTTDALAGVFATGEDANALCASPIRVGERLSGWVAATRQPIVNSDARLDLDEAARQHTRLRSALAVPVEADGRVVGILAFYAAQGDAFDDTHRRLAQVAAYATARSRVSLPAVAGRSAALA